MTTTNERFFAHFAIILEEEKKLMIIFLISMFGPLNIHILATLLGKTIPPISRWVKMMVQEDLLVKDTKLSKTARGTFYKLSDFSQDFLTGGQRTQAQKPNEDHEIESQSSIQYNDDQARQILRLGRSLGMISEVSMKALTNIIEKQQAYAKFLEALKQQEMLSLVSFEMIHFRNQHEMERFMSLYQKFMDQIYAEFKTGSQSEPTAMTHSCHIHISPTGYLKQKINELKNPW